MASRLAVWLLAFGTSGLAPAAAQDEAVAAWFRERARPLALGDEVSPEPWAFLGEAVGDARVVLLGEELHGVREFLELKGAIARTLIEEQGFDTLVLEQDSARCARLERALREPDGDPTAELARAYWCWNNGEFAAFLEGLRARERGAKPPVALVGIDNQGPGDAPERLRAIARSSSSGGGFDPEPALALFPATRDEYPKGDEEAARIHARLLAELRSAVDAQGAELGPERLHDALDAVRVLEEVQALWSAPDTRTRMNRRDRQMAERTLALARDPARRLLVWAHNAHASRAPFYGGVEPLGKHLSAEVPTLVVGFFFGSGEVRLDPRQAEREGRATRVIPAPPAGSLAETLAAVGGAAWAVDLRAVDSDEVRRFLAAPPPGHFDNYGPAPELLGAVDVLVFVERVHPASPPR